ncbi:AAA family ATPase [Limnoraphis robusta]|uniref:AAA family ATPase n=1 Tax=Limnoraphis robusta CCNP1315 TaxID=3110306 RepID=A0ABU5U6L5_9CYAN|nr:AAA family ATPase [Limnoraphis robusta]MEA5522863.1 AAA family ATPase [Limnoraphis robusta CCNP1315]MEA5546875.1 AAA family ATPase [Limnoraphis robusta CCNP1324]
MTSDFMLPDFNNIGASFTTTFVDETLIDLAERIIGGLILDPNAIERIDDLLNVDLFPLKCQQKTVRAIKDLYASQKPVDLITVTMELYRRGELDLVGGQKYLANILAHTVSAVNIDQYLFMLIERIEDCSPNGKMRPAKALELVGEMLISDRSEEQLAIDLEDLREKVGMPAYKWDKFIAATMRKCRKVRYKLELKRLLAIGDELERSVEIDEVCEIYRKGRRTVEKDLLRMEAKTLTPDNNGFNLMNFLQQETQGINWIYPGIVPAGELLLLTAQAKCGKTLWATDLMYAVLSGTPLHGNEIPQGRVLYVYSDEASPRSVIRRLRNRGFDLLTNYEDMRLINFLDLSDLSTLETELENFRPTLVVIDSLTSISTNLTVSEKDPEFARHVYKLGKLLGKYNAAGVLIHHENKSSEQKGIEKVSGTARLTAAVWGIAQMKAAQPDNPKCTERFLSVTPREGSPETYLFDLNPKEIWSEQGIFSFTGELGDETGQKRTQGDRVLALLKKYQGKGLEYQEIDEKLNIGRSLYTVLDRLEDRKLITRRRSTVNPRRWVYLVPDNTTEEVKNDTTNFSLTDPSFTQQAVELNAETVDIKEIEVSQQSVNNSINEVNNLVNTDPVENPTVEFEKSDTANNTAVSQQNSSLNTPPKKNVVQQENTDTDTTNSEPEIKVGDRVKILFCDKYGTVEAIDPQRVQAPYHIRLDNGCTTDEPKFNLERV